MLKVSFGLLILKYFFELADRVVSLICQLPPVGAQLADVRSALLSLKTLGELDELLFDLEQTVKVDFGI